MGVVSGPTGAPEMNAIVRSPYGGEETRTDPNGVFFLNNILVYDKLGYITITKPGFHQGSRSFLPLETGSNRVNVQLLSMTQSGSFSATSGGTVTSGLLQLNFPANAIQLNGQPYSGIVNVFAEALDPTSTAMFDQMPGELLGGMNDSLRLLRSFGMASIELRDDYMNELQLATGVSATLTFNIPAAMQAEAPATIDWWSFDEALGYWKHEGEAIKQDAQYVAQASHFSWWNCDQPEKFNNFNGTVSSTEGTPISDAQINVISPTLGIGVSYTNANGEFSGRVPKNQQLTLDVYLICSLTNDWDLVHNETIVSDTLPIYTAVTASLIGRYPITGSIVNCEGLPIETGYLKMGTQIFLADSGAIFIQTCSTGNFVIQGIDTSNPDTIKVSSTDTVQVMDEGANIGEIQACSQFFGVVSDIDSNVYSTVLIGNQMWMAENLRTSKYNNNEQILEVNDNTWTQISTGAWCYFINNPLNNNIYGKLYNWFTIADPRGLCPAGWHVPSSDDWNTLVNFLDPDFNPTISGTQSTIAGGKMKSTTGWNLPNNGASNESGFSGLPGGNRDFDSMYFYAAGFSGTWWSSTESTDFIDNSHSRSLGYDSADIISNLSNKRSGISVRCIKD
jgi:uncharacterized protein (TIGR02145 family)